MKYLLALVVAIALLFAPVAIQAEDDDPAEQVEAEEAEDGQVEPEEPAEEDGEEQDAEAENLDEPDDAGEPAENPEQPIVSPKDMPALLKYRTGETKAQNAEKFLGEKSKEIDVAIHAALLWLKSAQEDDGSWDGVKWEGANISREVSTAMALLPFLGNGCSDSDLQFGEAVKKALEYLIEKQVRDGGGKGSWGIVSGFKMYEEGIIAIAICEAAALMPENEKLKKSAQRAIDFIASVQAPDGGFGYQGPGDDNSVSNFQFQALKAAIVAGLDVPADFKARTSNWLKTCVAKDGSTAYRPKIPQQPGRDSMTAASLASRLLLGEDRNSRIVKAQTKWLVDSNFIKRGQPEENNIFSVYYFSLSMFQMGDELWGDWRDTYIKTLIDKQEKEGGNAGSWPKKACQWGGSGGRIYTTAFACLSLQAAYRYERK